MKKRIQVEFEIETDDYDDVTTDADLFELVAGMLDGFADFPPPEEVTIKCSIGDPKGNAFLLRNAKEVLIEVDAKYEAEQDAFEEDGHG